MTLLRPPALRSTDTIALISPSSRLNDIYPARLQRAVDFLQTKLVRKVDIIFDPIPNDLSHQQAIIHRCNEIHSAFRNPSIRAIVCTIGGINANELLPHLDYDLIRTHPKIFVGYSDITLLHHAFASTANLRTFYGPAAICSLGEFPQPLQFTAEHFWHVVRAPLSVDKGPVTVIGQIPQSVEWTQEVLSWDLEKSNPESLRARHLNPNTGWKWLRPGFAEGRLTGGCLPSVCQLAGTKYLYLPAGAVLFLETPESDTVEDTPWPLEVAQSNLADLRNAGVFADLRGLILGRPYAYNDSMVQQWEKMVIDQMYDLQIPIVSGVDIGHTEPMLTLPMGAKVVLDSSKGRFEVLESGVDANEAN